MVGHLIRRKALIAAPVLVLIGLLLLALFVPVPFPQATAAPADTVSPLVQRWQSLDFANTYSVASADFDLDGVEDAIIGDYRGLNKLYLGDGDGALESEPAWISPNDGRTNALLAADIDGDGDADLLVGNDSPVQTVFVYRNRGGFLENEALQLPAHRGRVYAMAWATAASGTGYLALAIQDAPSLIFRNDTPQQADATPTFTQVFSTNNFSTSVATTVGWGDINADGRPDLALGYEGEATRIFVATADDSWPQTPTQSLANSALTTDLALVDLNRDGDLDLARVDVSGNLQFFLGNGTQLNTSATTLAAPQDAVGFVFAKDWADYDADGDPDLLLAVFNGQSRLYRNDTDAGGTAPSFTQVATWQPATARTRAAIWMNADSDGRPDLLLGNEGLAAFYRNTSADRLVYVVDKNNQPMSDALVYYRDDASFGYEQFTDYSGQPLRTNASGVLEAGRQLPEGSELVAAWPVPPAEYVAPLEQPLAFGDEFSRVVSATLTIAQPQIIRDLNLVDLDISHSWINDIKITLVSPSGTAVSIVNQPCSSEDNLLLSFDDEATDRPLPCPPADGGSYRSAELLAAFDGENAQGTWTLRIEDLFPAADAGELNGWGLEVEDLPYTWHWSSGTPALTTLNGSIVDANPLQTLQVSDQRPLLIFDLQVALEWDARNDEAFLFQLQDDLYRVSELLYDMTDGQAALGRITINHDRLNWDSADIRIYATNRMRPNADQGGVTSIPVLDPDRTAISYIPGRVRIGSVWSRYGVLDGTPGEDWPRALAHELGHYLFYLNENYLGIVNGELVSVAGCSGMMADPYQDRNTELYPANSSEWLNSCGSTLSNITTARSDWQTLDRLYPFAAPSAGYSGLNSGPSSFPLPLTLFEERTPQTDPEDLLLIPVVGLVDAEQQPVAPRARARAFLFKCSDSERQSQICDGEDYNQIIDLGRPTVDQVYARGALPGDQVCVYDPLDQRLGCQVLQDTQNQLGLLTIGSAPVGAWEPDVVVTPVNSRTLTISVTNVLSSTPLQVQLFPMDNQLTPPPAQTLSVSGDALIAQFSNLANPALGAYIYVWEPNGGAAPLRSIVTEYALGGNPVIGVSTTSAATPRPTRVRTATPNTDGLLEQALIGQATPAESRNAAVSADGQVVLFGPRPSFLQGEFYTVQSATRIPDAPPWAIPLGQGYWLIASKPELLNNVGVNVSYLESDLPAGTEGGIDLYYRSGNSWQRLSGGRRDPYRNEVTEPVRGAGLYALMTSVNVRLGWNLFSYPWQAPTDVADALRLIGGSAADGTRYYTTVYGYDPDQPAARRWQIYDSAVPAWVNSLQQLQYGRGYWINVTAVAANAAAASNNSVQPQVVPLPPAPPATYYGTLDGSFGFVPQSGQPVRALINGAECGSASTQIQDGQVVYVVQVDASTGSDTRCGTLGRWVSFEVNGRLMGTRILWDNDRPQRVDLSDAFRLQLPLVRTR